jgi:hypothetical protein
VGRCGTSDPDHRWPSDCLDDSFRRLERLLRIYFVTQRDEVDYNLAYIGSDFSAPKPGYFDKAYMNALFEYAYQQARRGYPWQKEPPLLASNR